VDTTQPNTCRRCGAVIPAETTDRLCPACLMSGALGDEAVTISTAPGGALSLHGPSEFPCEFGGYRLVGLLGRGGMGVVYEAVERASGRRVALKVLGLQLDSAEMRRRFLREGRLAARVNHPNSLYVFGSEEIDGLPVITMEIAGAGTLKDVLKRKGALPASEAVDAVLDVIAGLEAASACGVLHRDIKPSNCFVCPDGSVKVGDFGLSVSTLAKADTLMTARGRIMGTPAYASPEQLRGDEINVRADIYSVGATLYTLLTDRAPFEGDNAVQVVANAVNKEPRALGELRGDLPAGLVRVVARCLAKDPGKRYGDYGALRNALLPFGSRAPVPVPMAARPAAGWIDFLLAFLPPYVALMLLVGAEELIVRPIVEPSLFTYRYQALLLAIGFGYFALSEGVWGAGLGKRLKGMRVVRHDGRAPGVMRALVRIAVLIAPLELMQIPLMSALIHDTQWGWYENLVYIGGWNVLPWLLALLTLTAKEENGFATLWGMASGTRVVYTPRGIERPSFAGAACSGEGNEEAAVIGPFRAVGEVIPGEWLTAHDPVLCRDVWLLRRLGGEPSASRREVARPGRPRWLQSVEHDGSVWDAFEVGPGRVLSDVVRGGRVPWGTLRHWLHDIAEELWAAVGDGTLPDTLSLDQVWITGDGRAVLLDRAWPATEPAERIGVRDLAGQQRFLHGVAAWVEWTGVPLHARPVLTNLAGGRFEKLSFLTGTLRGLLEKRVDVTAGVRAGSMVLIPAYTWCMVMVGYFHDKAWSLGAAVVATVLVLLAVGLGDLIGVAFRGAVGQSVFRLAVLDAGGAPAGRLRLLARWAIAWIPVGAIGLLVVLAVRSEITGGFELASVLVVAWLGGVGHAASSPHRGLHDRIAGTWVVRR